MKLSYSLSGALIGATIVMMQPQVGLASLSPVQISETAKEYTVLIDGDGIGSGIIIERQGNNYFVLTNRHVVDEDGRYEIQTKDGSRHPVYYSKELPGFDLAVVQFSSNKNYSIAKLGNSNQLREGMKVYVIGWATIPGVSEPSYQFTTGNLRSLLKNPDQGYSLVYNNEAIPGMSGGPVINENGLVVGINGRADLREDNTRTVLRQGIPINIYKASKKDFRVPVAARPKPPTTTRGTSIKPPTPIKTPPTSTPTPIKKPPVVATAPSNPSKKMNPDRLLSVGGARARKKDYQGALIAYNRVLRIKPNHPDAYFRRGVLYYNLRKYQDAYNDFNKVVRLNPSSAVAYMNRGLTQDLMQRNKEAVRDYSKAIRLKPGYAAAYLNRGAVKNELKDYQGALTDLNKAISLRKNYGLGYLNRGDAYIGLRNYQKAIADLNLAISFKPDNALAYSLRGLAYRRLGQYQRAILDYDLAIRFQPNYASAYFGRAFARRRTKDDKGALEDYSKVISISPKFAEAYYNRGLIYRDFGNKQKALTDFRKAATLYKQQGKSRYYQDAVKRIQQLQGSPIRKSNNYI
ncbi:MAG: tetratricopeptide repeat-containing serine protease family protein [Calothrix sp. MO_167.B12]|nr:tetratricopeptide repeat-containing serine protease family protein [Calothrix sp. MO_167.B12]